MDHVAFPPQLFSRMESHLMNRFLISAFVLLGLTTVTVAKEKYVPDYFPAPKGAEWNYKITTSNGMSMDMRQVVNSVTKLADGTGYEVIISSFTPTESVNTYHKVAGWVLTDKSVTPSANYTFDYVKDINSLMNPLVSGKTWNYEGTAGGLAVTQEWTCVGAESVKVPAGDFKAVKVTSTSDYGGNPSKYTFWYVDRVGLVKSITEAGGVTSTMELQSYTFPK